MAVLERVVVGGLAQGAVPPGYTFTRSTTALYVDSDGLLKSAAINTPRRQWDATNRWWGYVGEGSRTNSFLYSQDPSNAAWTKGNSAVTLAQTTGPDGLTSGAKVECTTTTNTTFYQFFTCNSTSVCFYAVVKIGTGATTANKYRIRNDTTATDLLSISLDYSTGDVTVNSGTGTAGSVLLGNGWILVWASTSTGITSGNLVRFYMGFNSSVSTAGDYFHLFHAQAEAGATSPSSIIPTTTVAVTRGADLLARALTGPEGTALSTAGTMVVEFSFLGGDSTADSGNRGAAYLQGVTSSDSIFVYNRSSAVGSLIYQASSNQAAPIVSGTAAAGVVQKCAVTWKANDVQFARNGSHGTRDTTATMPTLTQVAIGGTLTVAGNVLVYGWTISDDHYPTDAGMDALTTPTTSRNQSRLTLGLGLGL